MRRTTALLASGLLLSCGGSEATQAPTPTDPSTPTWTHDVAPLIAENCSECHHPGGLEVSLSNYDTAQSLGHVIDGMVSSRMMPPWPPTTDGDCPEFVGDRRLSQADVDLVGAWAAGGMPRGEGEPVPTPPPLPFGKLDGISVVLGPPAPYQPPRHEEDYRCFVVDPKLAADEFLTAYRVDAGAGVHHVALWEVPTAERADHLVEREARERKPGFPCFSLESAAYRLITVWGPVDPVRRHPAGTGIRIHAGKKLVLQIHYHEGAPLDDTTMGLVLADHVAEEATMVALEVGGFILPAEKPKTSVHGELPMASSAKLWGVRAHMHYFGSAASLTTRRGARSQCLLSIPRWDPNWQLMYFWERPMSLEKGDVLSLDCSYDTVGSMRPVFEGPTSTDEMCNGYYYMTGLPPGDYDTTVPPSR